MNLTPKSLLKSIVSEGWIRTGETIEIVTGLLPSSAVANAIAEPWRGMPWARYLSLTAPKRRRSLTPNTSPTSDSPGIQKDHDMVNDQDDSHFFNLLPLDVRLIIYNLVLGGLTFHILPRPQHDGLTYFVCRSPHLINDRHRDLFHAACTNRLKTIDRRNLLALPLTCRRAYSESISLLYCDNAFEFSAIYPAFRFLKLDVLPQRLQSIRGLTMYLRVPRHPLLNSRTERDWKALFSFFAQMRGLLRLHLHLDFLQPVIDQILDSTEKDGAVWTATMIDMANDAWYRNGCQVSIVAGNCVHNLRSDHVAKASSAEELHARIKQSLAAPD